MWWRRRRQREQWLDGWEAVAAARLPQWAELDEEERTQLGAHLTWIVRTKQWEAARGFELTQQVVVSIAAHAGLLILGLERRVYKDVRAIVVHGDVITQRGPRATTIPGVVTDGPRRVLGHALDRRGPVVLSWDAVCSDLRRSPRGQNVVLHEFSHKIDAADGLFDGTPRIFDSVERERWIQVCTAEYGRLRERSEVDPVLRPYARQSPSEFFAVATEVFFTQPIELQDHKPALYRVLAEYYGQDSASRKRRAGGVPPHAP